MRPTDLRDMEIWDQRDEELWTRGRLEGWVEGAFMAVGFFSLIYLGLKAAGWFWYVA